MNAPRQPRVLPSLMSADALHLESQLAALMDAGATTFHIDVMDGHFVPNLTLGTGTTAAINTYVTGRDGGLDVHLMVSNPGFMVELFAPHAAMISVHAEADHHLHRTLGRIRELGCQSGLALNPGTDLSAVEPLVDQIDFVNVMSVNPGFAGQSFIETTPARIRALRERLPSTVAIEVDGGIDSQTLPLARDAGATLFVSASSIFGSPDPVAAYRTLVDRAS